MTKKKQGWGSRCVVTLSRQDVVALKQYAEEHHVSPTIAMRQILHNHLVSYIEQQASGVPSNQLDIFDTWQLDIFNEWHRVEKE